MTKNNKKCLFYNYRPVSDLKELFLWFYTFSYNFNLISLLTDFFHFYYCNISPKIEIYCWHDTYFSYIKTDRRAGFWCGKVGVMWSMIWNDFDPTGVVVFAKIPGWSGRASGVTEICQIRHVELPAVVTLVSDVP